MLGGRELELVPLVVEELELLVLGGTVLLVLVEVLELEVPVVELLVVGLQSGAGDTPRAGCLVEPAGTSNF